MPVSATDLLRRAAMPARSNRSSDARSGARPRIGGLLSCQPSAPVAGMNCGAIWKRVASSWPHQPAKRGRVVSRWCRSCTNAPATAPGPLLRYL
ncbi:hypothetical protein G6F59_018511 [Rhizopus arrhizus]|nr:hypothetical protein G6F59_018511 [Rhizopus arrhizus]